MKRIAVLVVLLLLPLEIRSQIHLNASDEITLSGRTLDSSGFYITPDSVRIVVYRDGSEMSDDWYNSADAQCSSQNEMLVFTNQVQDIDGAGGDGLYEIMAGFFEDDGDMYLWKSLQFYIGVDMGELSTFDPSTDSVMVDGSTLAATSGAITATTLADSAITAATIKNGAIHNAVISDGEKTLIWEIGSGTIGSGVGRELLDNLSNAYDSLKLYDTRFDSLLAASADGSIGDKVWSNSSTRSLTELDEDNTTVDLDGSTIGTAMNVTNGVTIATNTDKTGYSLAGGVVLAAGEYTKLNDTTWGAGTRTLSNPDDYKATVAAVIDTVNAILDTLQLYDPRLDSLLGALTDASMGNKVWADASTRGLTEGVTVTTNNDKTGYSLVTSEWEEIWRNIDTTNVDSSAIGDWLENNLSDSNGSCDLTNVTDTVNAILDTLHMWYDEIDQINNMIDSLYAVLDTLQAGFGSRTAIGDTIQRDASTLTAADNIGINLNDVAGTLDEAELGYQCITSNKIAMGSFWYGHFAQSAFDSIAGNVWRYDTADISTADAIGTETKKMFGGVTLNQGEYTKVGDTIWATSTRELTALDEDNTVIDIDGQTVATVSNAVSLSDEDLGRVADSVWGKSFDAGFSSGSMGDSLNSSSYVQGEASGLTASAVADAVWDESSTQHQIEGTFGRHLDTEVSGLGSGSGAYAITIYAADTTLDQAVPNTRIAVRNLDQTTLIAVGATDSQGRANFNLDADSFLVTAVATGYLFEVWDTIVVSQAGVDSILGERFDPGSPASPGLCRLYGYVADVQGQWEQNSSVSASLPWGVVRSTGLIVSPNSVSTQTDSLGYFYLDLIPSDSLIGDDTRYEVTISRHDGTILRKRLSIPALTNWQLTW